MNVQGEAWLVTLIGLAAVTLAFVHVVIQAGKPPPDAGRTQLAYKLRGWLFAALVVFGIGITYATLRTFPIPVQSSSTAGAQVVHVTAHQWRWEIAPDKVAAGTPVEFRVTSADVNHGFAIYGPDERIVTQTQAMPGFTNRLVYTFTTPGTYRILCLEYCGLAHHGMQAEVHVTPAQGGRS
jgi:cytochrome c oxidase subunit 2